MFDYFIDSHHEFKPPDLGNFTKNSSISDYFLKNQWLEPVNCPRMICSTSLFQSSIVWGSIWFQYVSFFWGGTVNMTKKWRMSSFYGHEYWLKQNNSLEKLKEKHTTKWRLLHFYQVYSRLWKAYIYIYVDHQVWLVKYVDFWDFSVVCFGHFSAVSTKVPKNPDPSLE